jgi:hypothetical protein
MEVIIGMCTEPEISEHSAMEGEAADILDYLADANRGMEDMKESKQQ